jgi:hypothetical protein
MEFVYNLFSDYTSEPEDVPMEFDDTGGNPTCVIA